MDTMYNILLAVGLLMTVWSWLAVLGNKKRKNDTTGAVILGAIATLVMLAMAWQMVSGG